MQRTIDELIATVEHLDDVCENLACERHYEQVQEIIKLMKLGNLAEIQNKILKTDRDFVSLKDQIEKLIIKRFVECPEGEIFDFEGVTEEILKLIFYDWQLSYVVRKHWKILLTAIKRWSFVHKNDLAEPSKKASPALYKEIQLAEKELGEAMKEVGL